MYTIIRSTCTLCGDVELRPSEVELRICSDPRRSVYAFSCPRCEAPVVRPAADPRVVGLLRSAGVRSVGFVIPGEVAERPSGPPLTSDDLLDLMLALERPDWFDRLTSVRSAR